MIATSAVGRARRSSQEPIWTYCRPPSPAGSARSRNSRGLGAAAVRGDRHPAQFTERHELAVALVPQHEADAAEALQQGQPAHVSEVRVIAQHIAQTVEWNAA